MYGKTLHTPYATFRRVVVSLRGHGQSPVLLSACCVGSLCSVGCHGPSRPWSSRLVPSVCDERQPPAALFVAGDPRWFCPAELGRRCGAAVGRVGTGIPWLAFCAHWEATQHQHAGSAPAVGRLAWLSVCLCCCLLVRGPTCLLCRPIHLSVPRPPVCPGAQVYRQASRWADGEVRQAASGRALGLRQGSAPGPGDYGTA